LTPLLKELGVLGDVDRDALAAYCVKYSEWVEATGMVKDKGMILSGKNGAYTNPAVWIAAKALKQMIAIGTEFGMTPSSRSRIKVEPAEKKDDFEEFLKHKA